MLTHHMQQLKSSTHFDIEDMCMIQIQVCTISKVDTMTQKTGRFINADDTAFISSSGTVLSCNIFVYCENNPINLYYIQVIVVIGMVG